MADPIVLDTLEVRFRPIEDEEGMTATHVLDAHDLGVLAVTLTLLGERNPVRFEGWGHAPAWPRREPRIAPVEHLRQSLIELRRLGFLSLRVEGGTANVSYGTRTREIATRWSIPIPEVM